MLVDVTTGIPAPFDSLVRLLLKPIKEEITTAIQDSLKEALTGNIDRIANSVKTAIGQALAGTEEKIKHDIRAILEPQINRITAKLTQLAQSVFDRITPVFTRLESLLKIQVDPGFAALRNVEVDVTAIGISDANAFIGAGPYWIDLNGNHEVSWAFNTGTGNNASRTISAGSITLAAVLFGIGDVLPANLAVTLTESDGVVKIGSTSYGDIDGDGEVDTDETWTFNTGTGNTASRTIEAGSISLASVPFGVGDVLPDNVVGTLATDALLTVGGVTYGNIDHDLVVDANETGELDENAIGLLDPEPQHGARHLRAGGRQAASDVHCAQVDRRRRRLHRRRLGHLRADRARHHGRAEPGRSGPCRVRGLERSTSSRASTRTRLPIPTCRRVTAWIREPRAPRSTWISRAERILASVAWAEITISEFVHIAGSFAFEKGTVETVQVGGGLLTGLTGPAVNAILDPLGITLPAALSIPATGATTAQLSLHNHRRVGRARVHRHGRARTGPTSMAAMPSAGRSTRATETTTAAGFPPARS
jgi:hypothetical protein